MTEQLHVTTWARVGHTGRWAIIEAPNGYGVLFTDLTPDDLQ